MQRAHGVAVAGGLGGVELALRDPKGRRRQRQPVEALRVLQQGVVSPSDDVRDDGADGLVHLLGDLALRAEQRVEGAVEIRRARIETDRHQALPCAPAGA